MGFQIFLLIVISVCLIGIWLRCAAIADILQKHMREGRSVDVNITGISRRSGSDFDLPVKVTNWR